MATSSINVKRPSQITLSLNLIRAAQLELQFLHFVNHHPALYDGPIVQRAVRRYELLWLPLAANSSNKFLALAPPADVHWIWFVHMLAPEYYDKDCRTIVGSLVDHKLLKMKALKKAHKRTRKIWLELYPEEPFDVILDGSQPVVQKEYASKISYNLAEAVKRQSMFYYQVSLPHYVSKPFLKTAVERYKKFLYLKLLNAKKFIVPCYDMDIIWHAHMVHPKKYMKDTCKVLGHILNHDDSVNDRSVGSKLNNSDAMTRKLWFKVFSETFNRNGAMFRGEPPNRSIKPIPSSVRSDAFGCTFHVQVKKVIIGGAPSGCLKIKLFHQVRCVDKEKLGKITLYKETGKYLSEHHIDDQGFEFSLPDKLVRDQFVLELVSQREGLKTMLSAGSQNFECSGNFDFMELTSIKEENATIVKTFLDRDTRVELTFNVRVSKAPHFASLGVLTGPFSPTSLDPLIVRNLYGIVPHVDSDSDDQDSYFGAEMATHRIINESWPAKPQVMEVEVFHSRPLLQSAVHIYAQEKGGRSLIAVSHTVDLNTLPSPSDLSTGNDSSYCIRNLCLNQSEGERAMIIKTHAGDWALIIARWTGLLPGIPAASSLQTTENLRSSAGSGGGACAAFSSSTQGYGTSSTDYSGSMNGVSNGLGGGSLNDKSCSTINPSSVRSGACFSIAACCTLHIFYLIDRTLSDIKI